MIAVRVALAAVIAALVTLAGSASSVASGDSGPKFTVEYSGTVAETAQPNAVSGNAYSENITFDLKVIGTPEQLAMGEGTGRLYRKRHSHRHCRSDKPPEVPPATCQANVTVPGNVDYNTILAVSEDGSVGAQLRRS